MTASWFAPVASHLIKLDYQLSIFSSVWSCVVGDILEISQSSNHSCCPILNYECIIIIHSFSGFFSKCPACPPVHASWQFRVLYFSCPSLIILLPLLLLEEMLKPFKICAVRCLCSLLLCMTSCIAGFAIAVFGEWLNITLLLTPSIFYYPFSWSQGKSKT